MHFMLSGIEGREHFRPTNLNTINVYKRRTWNTIETHLHEGYD